MTELWCLRWTRPLTDTEKERLAALLPPRRRERKADEEALCAYGLLRFALGEKALPAIALEERGKPYFPDRPDLHFSLSHTEGAAMVGLSSAPIGVDIEKVRPLGPRVRGKLGANLSDEEAFRRWTALEARSNAAGKGWRPFSTGIHGRKAGTAFFWMWGRAMPAAPPAGKRPASATVHWRTS